MVIQTDTGPLGAEICLTAIPVASHAGVDEGAPGDTVRAERWDGLLITLSSVPDAIACLRVHGLSELAAADTAATVDLPLTLTKRGCVVYATKAAQAHPS